jgi:hypothetical protein
VFDQKQDAEFIKAQIYIKHKVLGKRDAARLADALSVDQLREIITKQRAENRVRLQRLR